jgi:hypothetical protein
MSTFDPKRTLNSRFAATGPVVIPPDIHEHVLDLTTELVNAQLAGDMRDVWRLYDALVTYSDAVAAEGRDHPFLWETLGDFTADDRKALVHYARALELAENLAAADYKASICLALARRHAELKEADSASAYAWRADEAARELDDLDLRREISQFLLHR